MSRGVCFFVVAALLLSHGARAQMQPHRADYVLRLGTAANGPKIGTAVQDITLDCTSWHIRRDISTEIALSSYWKLSLASKLEGDEPRDGSGFRYRLAQIQNGDERTTKGKIERGKGGVRADIASANGPSRFVLPMQTLMPVAAIGHLVERLRAKASAFPALVFDAEVFGDAFLVDVTEVDPGTLRPDPPGGKPVAGPAGPSWPVFMTFTRGREQDQKPLFSVSAKVYDNGVLDRLTIDTGLLKVGADLQKLEMHKAPACPGA
jgi:hypothetical protein